MDYAELKKLDEESAKQMQEGFGPVDECICSLLAGAEKRSIGASIKKAFASMKPNAKKKGGVMSPVVDQGAVDSPVVPDSAPAATRRRGGPQGGRRGAGPKAGRTGTAPPGGRRGATAIGKQGLEIPIVFNKGEKGIYSTKEVVKQKGSCGKCGCDKENIVMKHSYANIRITSPDVSSICPCPTNCLPDKSKLMNNIKVTIERMTIDPDSENSETSLNNQKLPTLKEPDMSDKKSITSLINAQYDTDEDKLYD